MLCYRGITIKNPPPLRSGSRGIFNRALNFLQNFDQNFSGLLTFFKISAKMPPELLIFCTKFSFFGVFALIIYYPRLRRADLFPHRALNILQNFAGKKSGLLTFSRNSMNLSGRALRWGGVLNSNTPVYIFFSNYI